MYCGSRIPWRREGGGLMRIFRPGDMPPGGDKRGFDADISPWRWEGFRLAEVASVSLQVTPIYGRALADHAVFHHMSKNQERALKGLERSLQVYDKAIAATGEDRLTPLILRMARTEQFNSELTPAVPPYPSTFTKNKQETLTSHGASMGRKRVYVMSACAPSVRAKRHTGS
eukprot:1549768-Pyramimonas_sp.AAC.1